MSRRELPAVAGPKGKAAKPAKAGKTEKAAKPADGASKSLFAGMFKKR